MAQQPRQYQSDALNRIKSNFGKGVRAQILQLATGGGKTTVASAIMQGAAAKGNRAYFIVDSLELVDQAAARFMADGLEVGIIQGDHYMTDYSKLIQVATIQTLKNRWHQIAPALRPKVVIIDEAHCIHAMHKEIIEECKFVKCPIIGLSATPFRKGLGLIFDDLVVGATTAMLTELGYLVPAVCYAPFVPDLKGIRTSSDGDWIGDALSDLMGDAQIVGDIVTNWLKLAKGRQTIVFCANVAHSKMVCEYFNRAGVVADHIDGYESDKEARTEKINAFRRGETTVMCNVAVLTKGFDAPETSCVVLARPTKSLMLHIQMIGRGLRTADHKTNCIAAGSKILTDSGLISIEHITIDHKVWDGVNFVSHDGAICQGYQPVMEYDGLTATEDHEVMTHEGWKTIAEASNRRLEIIKTGFGARAIRYSGNSLEENRGIRLQSFGGGEVFEVWQRSDGAIPQHEKASQYKSVQILQLEECSRSSVMALQKMPGSKGSVLQSKKSSIRAIRRTRDRVQIRGGQRGVEMDSRKFRATQKQGLPNRQGGQFRPLRGWKFKVVSSGREYEQYSSLGRQRKIYTVQKGLPRNTVCRLHALETNTHRFKRSGDYRKMAGSVEKAKREVWDILNAGPLQRFTANGRLVHNCVVIDHAGNCLRNGLPTDDLPEVLDMGKGDNPDRKERDKKEPVNKACGNCGHVSTKFICPVCGHKPERMQDIEVKDGELYEIEQQPKPKFTAEDKQVLISELYGYAISKGFKHGWVAHKFQAYTGEHFKTWHNIPPRPPSEKTMGIIKHLNIKNAKRRG